MTEFSPATLAAVKLGLVFALIVLLQRLRVALWGTILVAGGLAALFSGLYPPAWPGIFFHLLREPGFLILCVTIYLILLLSNIQQATGQSEKLVGGLERCLRYPRLRLVFFPAMIGLLPMPGGALFSCPMVRSIAEGMALDNIRKALINYWFRHIWELAWPLYPGYALACSLLGVSITTLWRYTFPLVFLSAAAGWFFIVRGLPPLPSARESGKADKEEAGLTPIPAPAEREAEKSAPRDLFMHSLPLIVTLLGAAVYGLLFDRFFPEIPGQVSFCLSLLTAVAIALYQGRTSLPASFRQLLFNAGFARLFLLLLAIFLFKDVLAAGGLVQSFGQIGGSALAVLCTVFFLPLVSGLLTGILVGLVGLSFPILLGVIEYSPLQEHFLPLAVLALVGGNCGQMLSPLHLCLVVTCDFFTTTLAEIWRFILIPSCALVLGGLAWAGVLYAAGIHF